MPKLTTSQAAKLSGFSSIHINYLIKKKLIKGSKLDPSNSNSPNIINEKSLWDYLATNPESGRPPRRCEPCGHQPKRVCATCKRAICLRDYRINTEYKSPSKHCKDCENKVIRDRRNKLKACNHKK